MCQHFNGDSAPWQLSVVPFDVPADAPKHVAGRLEGNDTLLVGRTRYKEPGRGWDVITFNLPK